MTATALMLLTVAGLLAVPQYAPHYRRLGRYENGLLYTTAAAQLVLLGAAALLALGSGGGAGWGWTASLAVLAAAVGGGAPATAILALSFNALHPEHQPILTDGDGEPIVNEELESQPVLRGGAWIGVLERIAVSTTLLMSWPGGLAIILAVKGLGRYSELGKSGAAERFILGTFASQLWACACTGVALLVV